MSQLPLALKLADHARLATFVVGRNASAVKHVGAVAGGAAETLWLSGPSGCGKTHLLQAGCRAAADAGRRAMYLALDDAQAVPGMLAGLDALDLLAVDRVDAAAGQPAWERGLFLILNDFASRRGGLLLAARPTAQATPFELPDLASRAAGAVSYRLQPLEDAERVEALIVHAEARGLALDRAVAEYLLNRVDRDMGVVGRWLDRLDSASLAEQRRITIPFVRELLSTANAG
jgi:DnaA-homolog protein